MAHSHFSMIGAVVSRIRKIVSLVLAAVTVLAVLPATASGAHGSLEAMRIISQQMGEGSLVRIMATLDPQTELPATIEILIPNEFTYVGTQLLRSEQFSEDAAAEPVGEATVDTSVGDTDTSYVITLDTADTALLEFVAPAGIFSVPANGHATIQLGLVAATDIKYLEYGFVLPVGAEAVGKEVVQFGETEEGQQIAGQIFENVPAGTRETARIAIGANAQAAAAALSAEASASATAAWFADQNNLIVMALIAAVILLGAVAVAIAIGRRRAAEDAGYGEYDEYEEFDESDYAEVAGEDVASDDHLVAAEAQYDADSVSEVDGSVNDTKDFFRD